MPTTGQWIRQRLIEAAEKGVVIADLHKERKANWRELGIPYRGGTYPTFVRLFRWLIDLGWVERTGETEAAFIKGTTQELKSPRIYYRLTAEGLSRPEEDYYDLIATVHPEWSGSQRSSKYRLPTGEPRGRPRIAPPKVKKPLALPRVKKPRVIKPLEPVLLEEEKQKLIKDFIEVMDREPTRMEIFTLFEEEVKLRQRKEVEEEG